MDDSVTTVSAANSSADTASSHEILVFNVGGVIFETYRSTLLRIPNSPLTNNDFLADHFRPERNQYFFDRDPDAFKVMLDYLRTGQLFIATYIDRPSLRNDLICWGLTSDALLQQTGGAGPTQQNDVKLGTVASDDTDTRNARIPETTRMKIWNVLSCPATSLLAKLYAGLAYLLMCASVFLVVYETTTLFHVTKASVSEVLDHTLSTINHEVYERENHISVYIIALVITFFFTVEYVVRIAVAPTRVKFVFSFLGVIDFLAIMPDYALLIVHGAFGVDDVVQVLILILGVFRILRVLRMFKHFKTPLKTELFVRTCKASAGELVFVACLFAIGTLVSGTVAYILENRISSPNDNHFPSIPAACYWAIITMTTVGYGDVIPITSQGLVLCAVSALCGLVLIGFLVSVLVNNFIECSKYMKNETKCLNVAYVNRNGAEYRRITSPSPEGENA